MHTVSIEEKRRRHYAGGGTERNQAQTFQSDHSHEIIGYCLAGFFIFSNRIRICF